MSNQLTNRWYVLLPDGTIPPRVPLDGEETPRGAWEQLYRAIYGGRRVEVDDYWIDDMQGEGYECVCRPRSWRAQ